MCYNKKSIDFIGLREIMDGKKIEQEILEITEELIKDYKSDRAKTQRSG